MARPKLDRSGCNLAVAETGDLTEQERKKLLELFEASYRQANPAYLERSLERLHYVAVARHVGTPVGFALGETRVMDLPRLPAQAVSLAGICCISPAFRRHGLFGALERLALTARRVPRGPHLLVCGRMAHPAAMRVMARNPSVVPKPGRRPTPWQREVGAAIAAAYGAHGFDPETFVCVGDGRPIGYPNLEFDAEPHEWEVFRPVHRERGDALLAISWHPDAPAGW